jgi:hypothetical protein
MNQYAKACAALVATNVNRAYYSHSQQEGTQMAEVKTWMLKAVCPQCHEKGTIREVSYGYPSEEMALDPEVILGGCIVYSNETRIHGCFQCGWEGTFRNGKVFIETSPVEKLEELLGTMDSALRDPQQDEEVKYVLLQYIRDNFPEIKFDDLTLRK